MNHLAKIAWRNVRKNWRHSLATMISIAAGFLALGLFEGYIVGMAELFEDAMSKRSMLGDFIIEKQGADAHADEDPWKYALGEKEQAFLDDHFAAHASEVVARTRFLTTSGLLNNGKTSTIFAGIAFDVAEGARIRGPRWQWLNAAGKPLQESAENEVNIGEALSQSLDCTVEGKVQDRWDPAYRPTEVPFKCVRPRLQLSSATEAGQLNAIDVNVSGIWNAGFKELDRRFVAMPLALAQRLLDTKSVSSLSVKLNDPERVLGFIEDLRHKASAQGLAIDVTPWKEHRHGQMYRQSTELMSMFRNIVMIIVVVVAGMSVLNTMYKAVSERIREIGTLRSIGFVRAHIIWVFGLEAAMLAVISCFLGLLATLVCAWACNALDIRYNPGLLAEAIPLTIALIPRVYLFAGVFLSAIAVVASLFPARQAARMAIPEALGHI